MKVGLASRDALSFISPNTSPSISAEGPPLMSNFVNAFLFREPKKWTGGRGAAFHRHVHQKLTPGDGESVFPIRFDRF